MLHVGSLTVHVLDFQIAATRKLAQPHVGRSFAVVAARVSRTVVIFNNASIANFVLKAEQAS